MLHELFKKFTVAIITHIKKGIIKFNIYFIIFIFMLQTIIYNLLQFGDILRTDLYETSYKRFIFLISFAQHTITLRVKL